MCVCVCVCVCLLACFSVCGLAIISIFYILFLYIIHFCHFLILASSKWHFNMCCVCKTWFSDKSVLLSCQLILVMQAGFLPFLVMATKCRVKCIKKKSTHSVTLSSCFCSHKAMPVLLSSVCNCAPYISANLFRQVMMRNSLAQQ